MTPTSSALMKLLYFETDVFNFKLCFAVISFVTCRSRGSCPKGLILFSNLSNSRLAKLKIILKINKLKITFKMYKMKKKIEMTKMRNNNRNS